MCGRVVARVCACRCAHAALSPTPAPARRFCPDRADFEDTVEKKDALVQIDAGAPAEEA